MDTGGGVRVEVRLGAGIHGPSSSPRRGVSMPAGSTVAHLVAYLVELDPGLGEALRVALPVIDGAQTGRDHRLADGDRVAFLLPVAGGASPPVTKRKGAR